MPHNTHPMFPAHADTGAHAGIEGGKTDHHMELLKQMQATHQKLVEHLTAPKKAPKVKIRRDDSGNAVAFEPEE